MDSYQPHPYYERPSFAEALHEDAIAKPMREHPIGQQLDEVIARARRILAGEPIEEAMYRNGVLAEPHTGQHLQGCRACYRYNDERVAPPAFVAEPEGHDEHLDDIEQRLAEVHIAGCVRAAGRAAFVPKGGA